MSLRFVCDLVAHLEQVSGCGDDASVKEEAIGGYWISPEMRMTVLMRTWPVACSRAGWGLCAKLGQ